MNLPGRLRLTTLGDVLGAVYRDRTSGVLELVETDGPGAGRAHRIHFVDGLVSDVESELTEARTGGGHLPYAAKARLDAERRERLEGLFQLSDARLAFHVARAGRRRERPLEPRDFLHGRARHRDNPGKGKRRDPGRARALATLGLPDGADRSSVLRAFRTLAARLHPDRFPSATPDERADLMRRFAEITAAYHALVA